MMRNSRSYNYMENVVSSSTGNDNNQKLKDRGECNGGVVVVRTSVGRVSDDADQQLISSWPSRHYTCNFCKRRFKSAQALGGHMNVHRRARALLRSQSISPPPISSPWHPTNIFTTAHVHRPQQNNHESHFIFTNPIPNWHLQNTHHRTRNPSYPIMSITLPSASMHVNPHPVTASACKHATGGDQYLHLDQPFNGVTRARNNSCIRVDQDKLGLMSSKKTNQDDALVSLRLGNGSIISNSTDQQDIDLELHL